MNLTNEEKKTLGQAAAFVASGDASICLWRWLSAAMPYIPKSEGDLYVAALRKLRHTVRNALEAEGYPGSGAAWLTRALLQQTDRRDDSGLVRGMVRELGMDAGQARDCLCDIRPALSRTPCFTEPVFSALGYYTEAEVFLEILAKSNAAGLIPAELTKPLPEQMLSAVSRIVYRQISAVKDAHYSIGLIRQMMKHKDNLFGDLHRSLSRYGGHGVYWNMNAFFAGFDNETDVVELQRHTELLELMKAFVIVEYRINQAGKKADAAHTNALCTLVLLMIGDGLKPAQKIEINLAENLDLREIDISQLQNRPDYVQTIFWMGMESALPNDVWKRGILRASLAKLVFPSAIFSKKELITMAVIGLLAVYAFIALPPMRPALLLCVVLLGGMYLLFKVGIDLAIETLRRLVDYVWEHCPIILVLLVAVMLWFFFKYEFPRMWDILG